MGGFSIGFGVGLSYPMPNKRNKGFTPPTYLSCFGTGIWEMEGYWLGKDVWKMQSTNPSFLPIGIWNNEGVFLFKDRFKLNTTVPNTKQGFEGNPIKTPKSYWNF